MRLGAAQTQEGSTLHRYQRRAAVAAQPGRYGLDLVEVRAVEANGWLLRLHFIPHTGAEEGERSGVPPELAPRHLQVLDEQHQPVVVEVRSLQAPPDAPQAVDAAFVREQGSISELSLSPLTLVLVGLEDVDPYFRQATFQLASAHDGPSSAPLPLQADVSLPPASYLARDFDSFRQLLLDRLRLTLPEWQERHVADVGVLLVELLAHLGDTLSYYQDAVATEAYLGTARRRASLRRHARLLDYTVHEGCNARTWIALELLDDEVELPAGTAFHTQPPPPLEDLTAQLSTEVVSCESMASARLYREHNTLQPYTWGAERGELPKGATGATLAGHFPRLRAGDVVVLEQVFDPSTGRTEDVDPQYRHAVRLSEPPRLEVDPLTQAPLTWIAWFPEDALPWSLTTGEFSPGQPLCRLLGNVVLVDVGRTHSLEVEVDEARRSVSVPLFGLRVVSAEPFDEEAWRALPASQSLDQLPTRALPCVRVRELRGGHELEWVARHDLLSSSPFDRHFVAEVNDGDALVLRFGDGQYGRRPRAGARLQVWWRSGLDHEGNMGADTLVHLEGWDQAVVQVRNPLPATGGERPELAERARRDAPRAFRTQERCVTEADYVELAQRVHGVQEAVAHLEWNGSWHVAQVHLLATGGEAPAASLQARVLSYLTRHSLLGMEVEVQPAVFVPLAIALRVGLQPGQVAGAVQRTLEQELGQGVLEDGRLAYFHPSAFGLGQPVYLAPVVARAAAVPGVAWVEATGFQRWGEDQPSELDSGRILLEPQEVARVQGSPGRPDLGLVEIQIVRGVS